MDNRMGKYSTLIDIAADFRKFLTRNTSKNSIILACFYFRLVFYREKLKNLTFPNTLTLKKTVKKKKKKKNAKNLANFGCISGEKLPKNGLT